MKGTWHIRGRELMALLVQQRSGQGFEGVVHLLDQVSGCQVGITEHAACQDSHGALAGATAVDMPATAEVGEPAELEPANPAPHGHLHHHEDLHLSVNSYERHRLHMLICASVAAINILGDSIMRAILTIDF